MRIRSIKPRVPLYQSHPAELSVPRPDGSLLGDAWVDPRQPQTWACIHDASPWAGHTILYEMYDQTREERVCRYIGITDDVVRRFNQHRADKLWWTQIDIAMLSCYVSRQSALAAELALIQVADPPYNTQGRVRP